MLTLTLKAYNLHDARRLIVVMSPLEIFCKDGLPHLASCGPIFRRNVAHMLARRPLGV